jgi:hypothetical protein
LSEIQSPLVSKYPLLNNTLVNNTLVNNTLGKAGMAAQAQQLPVPNAANLQAAVNGMTAEGNSIAQSVQAYNAHQQALNAELSLC